MGGIDIFTLVIYFAIVLGIGYVAGKQSEDNTRSFFLAGGNRIGWFAIGASLFASNISAEHFIGLAGSGASSGVAVAQFEVLACLILLLLGWFFVPYYLRTGVFTMPEFLEKRYNSACRNYLSMISIIAYIFTKVSVSIYAGSLVLEVIMGWNIWFGAIFLIVLTGIYSAFGGLRAVIYTEFFQTFVLVAGGIILTYVVVTNPEVGGIAEVVAKSPPSFFSMWKPASDPDFPWTGIIFGAPLLGIWYWCTDQMIVQRTLAAHNIASARKATVLAGFFKLLPLFILVLPGIAGRIIYPDVAPNKIYAELVNNLLSPGIKGVVVAALLAALMSSLASVFNSSSTLVVMDFYKKLKPAASEKELVRVGRIMIGVLIVVSLFWLPFIGLMSEQLYIYLQSVQGYISPPITAVFLAGLLWKRANGRGAFATLITGLFVGGAKFVLELVNKSLIKKDIASQAMEFAKEGLAVPADLTGEGFSNSFIRYFAEANFLHFSSVLFLISVAVIVIVSLCTKAPTTANLEMFDKSKDVVKDDSTRLENVQAFVFSVLLVVLVCLIWIYFSPLFFK